MIEIASSAAGATQGMEQPLSSPIDITNINEKVYLFLKNAIIEGTYTPGAKLTNRKLQSELGVSQTPIKDALLMLAGEGMVEISSRRGTFVRKVTRTDLLEILDTRLILETGAVDLLIPRITLEAMSDIKRSYRETLIEPDQCSYRLFMEKDSRFHLSIVTHANNRTLTNIYSKLNAHMHTVRFRSPEKVRERLPETNGEHEAILRAITDRNAAQAKRVIQEHLLKIKKIICEEIESR
jgi:DNA-binding GntR family transcriptional regulator